MTDHTGEDVRRTIGAPAGLGGEAWTALLVLLAQIAALATAVVWLMDGF